MRPLVFDMNSGVRAGDAAPEFELPWADRDGSVALRDYLGRSPVFLALFRGLYCAVCRRAVASLGRLPKVSKDHWDLATRINPTGELSEAVPIWEANKALGRLDQFTPTQTDRDDMQRTWNQLTGLFLIDRTGIVRWVFVEAANGPAGMGTYPPEKELVNIVETLLR